MNGPPEPRNGQDDPPDLLTALRATVKLLGAVRGELAGEEKHEDLRLRAGALRAALQRLIDEQP